MGARAVREVVSRRDWVNGTVVSVSEDRCTIELADRSNLEARIAVSCWVRPMAGDTVLISGTDHAASHYVLAVLERSEVAPIKVHAPAGLEISVPTLRLGAKDMQLVFGELALCGRQIVARSETMQAIGRHASLVLERLHSRLQRAYKVVSEIEHSSSKHLNLQVGETLSMHCKNGVVTAEELVKLDGKLIQLG